MDVRSYIQAQFTGSRQLCDAAVQGTTDEQFNWAPPGTANPIKATLLHIIGSEDFYIQGVLQNKKLLWESEEWPLKVGVSTMPGCGQGWEEATSKALALGPMLEYQQAVRDATDSYFAGLTPEELDRKGVFAGAERSVADALVILAWHNAFHTGEIAALKGVQGAQGLPF